MEMLGGELRKINCDLGSLSRADGSAIYASGGTVAVAAVNGPCEVNLRKMLIDEAAIEVVYRPKIGQTGIQDKLMESMLAKISTVAILTTQHPRTLISITVQEMQNCGGLLACSINALCLALIHSGVPMRFLFAAVTSMLSSEGEVIVDPDHKQLKTSRAEFTLMMDDKGNIISADVTGYYDESEFSQITVRSQEAATKIFQFYRDIVRKYSDRISL